MRTPSLFSAGLTLLLLFGPTGCDGKGADEPKPEPVSTAGPDETPPPEKEPDAEPSAKVDLSNDAAVRKAFKAATGKELHEDSCIGQTGVEDIVVIGDFAHDRGCDVSGGFVNGEFLDAGKLFAEGLGRVGWADLDEAGKIELAQQWMLRVQYQWGGSVVSESGKAFEFDDTPKFAAPEAKADGDAIVVTAWVEEPPGMQDIDVFDKIEMRVAADGAVTTKSLERFAIDGERTRG